MPSPPQSRRWPIIALVTAIVMVGGATVLITGHSSTPEDVVGRYFHAIAAGDADTARSLMMDSDREQTMLTNEVLAAAAERISDIVVSPIESSVNAATPAIEVSYALAGERYSVTVTVAPGDRAWGFVETWQVDPLAAPLVTFRSDIGDEVMVAGVPIANNAAVSLFPAVYPLAASNERYLALDEDHVVVTGEDPNPSMDIVTAPTSALESEVQAQVRGLIDECAGSSTVSSPLSGDDAGCPLVVVLPEGGVADGVWTIVEYPTVEIQMAGLVYTTSGGQATFTPDGGDPVDMPRGIEIAGTIELSAGGVTLIPSGS